MANSSDIAQSDLAELLNVLGMGDHSRPQSPHEVFQEALGVLRKRLAAAGREPGGSLPPMTPAATPEAQGAWRWTARDGCPIRNGEFGEQWLLTWSEGSATYDVACIDNDWPDGEPIKLLCMDAWRWIETSPGEPPAPPPSGQEG